MRLLPSSLRSRLILLVLLPIIPLIALLLYSVLEQRRAALAKAEGDTLNLAREISENHTDIVEGAHQLLASMAHLPQVHDYDSSSCNALFSRVHQRFPLYTIVGAAKPNGDVFCSSPASKKPVNLADRPYFQEILKIRALVLSGYQIGRVTGKANIPIAYPSLDKSGNVRAVVFVGIEIGWIDRIVANRFLPQGSAVSLIDPSGLILYRHPQPEKWVGKTVTEPNKLATLMAPKKSGVTEMTGLDGATRLYAFSRIRNLPETRAPIVRVGVLKATVFAEVNRTTRRDIIVVGLILLLALIAAGLTGERSVLRPAHALMKASDRLATGDLRARTGLPHNGGELGQLARSFDSMAAALQTGEIQRKQAEEEIRLSLERAQALHDFDVVMTSTLDLKSVLNVLLEKIDLTLPYSATTVRLFNKETGLLEPVACRNLDEQEWKVEKWRGGCGLANAIFEAKRPVVILNAQTDPRVRDPDFYREHRLVSYLGIPLIAKGENLGVLSFYTKERHEFGNNETEFLTTMTNQAAIAIHNSQLYEAMRGLTSDLAATNRRLESSLRELSGLYAAVAPLAPSESLHQLLDGIIDKLMKATGSDAALLRLRDTVTGKIASISQRGFPDFLLEWTDKTTPGAVAAAVFSGGDPVISSDIASDPRIRGKMHLEAGFRSCAFLPLKTNHRVKGMVLLSSRELGYFNEGQRDYLMSIARQMAIAIENRALFDELRTSKDELERASKVKDEFLSVMSHELRTPLSVVVGYTGMIKDGMLGEINSEQEKALEKVLARAKDQLTMINSILQATHFDAAGVKAELKEVNLSVLLDDLKTSYSIPRGKELTLNWDYASELPEVKTDGAKLKQILQNLIENAIKFTEKGTVTVCARLLPFPDSPVPRIGEGANRGGSEVEFAVTDTGIGIAKEMVPIIFEKFRQVDSSETRLYGGTGLGLYIVKMLTEILGGKIDVESEPGRGSSFTVTIPIYPLQNP